MGLKISTPQFHASRTVKDWHNPSSCFPHIQFQCRFLTLILCVDSFVSCRNLIILIAFYVLVSYTLIPSSNYYLKMYISGSEKNKMEQKSGLEFILKIT